MGTQVLNMPIDIPWQLIHQSPDMMDITFCNKRFPFEWRSSLAISVFEPKPEDLPEDLCEGIITYLKVTCTITGYQPTKEETDRAYDNFLPPFGNVPTEGQLDDILRDYWACYGVLLNVAVFPFPGTKKQLEPVRVDFSRQHLGDVSPNPMQIGQVTFQASGYVHNNILEITLQSGEQKRVLDLRQDMNVTFPATARVEAKVVHRATAVTMEAYKGTQLVGSQTTGPEQDQINELKVEGEEIDRVVFEAPQNEAFLVEFAHYVVRDVAVDLKDFPHIIDFEPKTRDLYQAATQDAEILTGSSSKVTTDKTFANNETTESGFGFAGKLTAGLTDKLSAEISGNYHHNTKDTNEDRTTIQADATRERREKNATTTNLSQMYNLLTGYHPGTNRAVFLMLPRPHVLQATDYRTFNQGLRNIEGVQQFFLIVARPKSVPGLCIEAFLETGHFPENVQVVEPEVEYDERHEDFIVTAESRDDAARPIEEFVTSKYTVESGWVIDRREKRIGVLGNRHIDGWDPGHPGIKDIDATPNELTEDGTLLKLKADGSPELDSLGQKIGKVTIYNYQPISDSTVLVSGRVLHSSVRHFMRNFRVYTRSEQPKPSSAQAKVPIDRLLITSRCLCVCFKSGECPEVVLTSTCPQQPPPVGIVITPPPLPLPVSIVDERIIEIDPALLTREETAHTRLTAVKFANGNISQFNPALVERKDETGQTLLTEGNINEVSPTLLAQGLTPRSRLPAMKELLRKIQSAMTNSGRLRTRLPFGEVGFLDSDYFKDRIKQVLPPEVLGIRLANVPNLPAEVVNAFGGQATVANALVPDLARFARRTGLSIKDAANARFILLTAKSTPVP